MIDGLWVIVCEEEGEDGLEEGIVQYPLGGVMLALDEDAAERLVDDARRCNHVWMKKLKLVKFTKSGEEVRWI